MFNGSKRELNQIRSEAGQFRKDITDKFNANSGQLNKRIADVEKELDFEGGMTFHSSLIEHAYRNLLGLKLEPLKKRTLKTVIKEITDRLDHQEKMQKMLFAHLGIEYAKTTEETATGKREKEVLRRIKKQKN
jgi:hypothetical protein